jgi:DnaK suppressor protein
MTPERAREMQELTSALISERAQAEARLRALDRSFAEVVAYSDGTPPDDEHDPEGATVGWERAQLSALREQTHERLKEIDAALGRLHSGTYGRCETCSKDIGADRLLARPSTRHCIVCA